MAESDALRNFSFKQGDGLFTTFEDGEPVKLRVLTTNPLVALDKWGGTKFAFIVYNHTASKAQILNRGASIAKEIQKLHQDEDWGANIKKIDIKITADGTGKDTRYTVTPVKETTELTNDQIRECREVKLEDKIENGQRMSFYNPEDFETNSEKPEKEPEEKDIKIEDVDDEPINLDDIPF
jgi:hypothetical protein